MESTLKYNCAIYEKRPDICKRYPEVQGQQQRRCSFTFDKVTGEREGSCSQCGACCFLFKDIFKLGDEFVKGNACKHLKSIGEKGENMGLSFYIPTNTTFWDTFTGDDFTGNNDDPIDPVVWTPTAEYSDEFLIQSNKANVSLTASDEARSISTFRMGGDFSVQIDLDSLVIGGGGLCRFTMFDSGIDYGLLLGVLDDGSQRVHGNFYEDGSWQTTTYAAFSNNNGQLLVRRVGSHWYLEFKDGGGSFTPLKDSALQNSADLDVRLQAICGGGGDSISVNFDNFVINSGTVVPPA